MADYYPLLARALDGLPENTEAARLTVYERAGAALVAQLRAVQPPLGEAEIARERAALEDAVSRAERFYGAAAATAAPAAAGVPAAAGGVEPDEGPQPATAAPPRAPDGPRERRLPRGALVAAVLAAVVVPIAVLAWLWRDQPSSGAVAPAGSPSGAPPSSSDPKYPGRVTRGETPDPAPDRPGGTEPGRTTPAGQDVAVAQRAALVEENTADPQQPKLTQGRAFWRLDNASGGQGQPLETVVRATVEVPDAGLTLQLVMKKNRDATLPASHTIELVFTSTTPQDPNRIVRDVNPPLFRGDDGARGVPVAALSVPVKENVFLIGLSDLRSDVERNMELMRNRSWVELPVRFASGLRATLVFEKGATGDRVLADAFAAWGRS